MIPSVVASEITDALRDFLATGFGASTSALSSVVDDFLAEPDNLAKGPYLSIALPFRLAPEGGEPFPDVPLTFTPYRHQRFAFNRLAADAGRSTVIATGTGSGKTECFLYPILDHCRRQTGSKGIKAILIYPMNALATDRARRIAEIVHASPALRGRLTAGLYIGEAEQSSHTGMGPEHVITDRATLREHPPDILLTNYKMLDFLLIRPQDHRLWRHNDPATLRYLVVDELHTFDGAQGTDLACLVRRLRARVGAVRSDLICVGTSATIGGGSEEADLLDYVSAIFDQRFEAGSIVGEVRQSIDEFLGDALIGVPLLGRDDLGAIVDPARHASAEAYLRAQHELFFDAPIAGEFAADGWRLSLADRLREHVSFVNLLRVLDGRPKPLSDVADRLRRSLPVASHREAMGVVNSLCALISVARRREGVGDSAKVRPFLQVGLHLWVRELRRMVCSLCEEPEGDPSTAVASAEGASVTRHLRHSDDLQPDEGTVHLPLIQCRECHATGWGTVIGAADRRVGLDLRRFYNRFFSRDVDVQYLFPSAAPAQASGYQETVCGACGFLHAGQDTEACTSCGSDRLVGVFRPHAVTSRRRGNRQVAELSRDCSYCGAREALIILGARASSLLSVALGQTFASRHNDDHKVIAFSDNVQDAAHRAGFFAARTWRNSIRAAIAQVVAAHDGITLAELPDRVAAWWGDRAANPGAFDAERFVSEFIAPDRLWLREFVELQRRGRLSADPRLPDMVARRMRWDTLAELGYASTIGRTVERTRAVAVGVEHTALEQACIAAGIRIREEFEQFRDLGHVPVRALILGILRRMKDRGATASDLVAGYLAAGGSRWRLGRDIALQEFGPRSAVPIFPADRAAGDGLEQATAKSSWYRIWVETILSAFEPLAATQYGAEVLRTVLDALESAGLVRRVDAGPARAWALAPERFYTTARVAVMLSSGSGRTLVVPEREAELWLGVPCLELGAPGVYERHDAKPPTWFGRLYRETAIRRIVAAEHTALVSREERDRLQHRFAAPDPQPWEPNLLSATPTLELGIDIGDLSTVVLCSVPPAPTNYLQRIGRAGRRDGNALTLTVATGQPHDLYFYAEPLDMLASRVSPPGVFLNASAVLERQLTAFCLDCWVATGLPEEAVPRTVRAVLDNVEKARLGGFPYPFLDFAQEHADRLRDAFLDAFSEDLTQESIVYLTQFLEGDAGGQPPLRFRILSRLREVAAERRSLRAETDALRRRIAALRRAPPDDATTAEIKELFRERGGLQRLLRDLNGRSTFNFLTDEGLIPNYAFPQAGVTLHSVIYRRRETDSEQEADGYEHEHEVFEYLRPASVALHELAPENEFYAGGRHVRIDRIDLSVSPIESWRLCRACTYCENVDPGDEHAACPRCGDPLWSDAGQMHDMLRLRLVHAVTEDRRSRIIDDRDDREPLFYTRQLVADFEPAAVGNAYAVSPPGLPFGFEYVASATFREMNFGRVDDTRRPTTFAGVELPREGFRVCRHCGTVQTRRSDAPEHTRSCPRRGREGADVIVDCLYLYREFSSEAVRMLIPIAGVLGSQRRISSFVAALELGLRLRFGGKIDHLQATICEYPIVGTTDYRRYLMLYDTVPGGTGYLKDLMSDPAKLLSVFATARDALRTCECNRDAHKDGCYRCVFAYRRSREMESTSRDTALEIVEAILEHADDLKKVDGIGNVKIDTPLDSDLEARFVEALSRIEIDGQAPQVRYDLIQGKPGYVLRIGERTWYMEPQANLSTAHGVAVPSRADFLLRPTSGASGSPAVAVFMDSFRHHRDVTDSDSAKRTALVRAGFLQWSLTWHDLETAFGNRPDEIDPMGVGKVADDMADVQQALDRRWNSGALRSRLAEPSLTLLVRYLADPDPERWKRAVFADLFCLFDRARMLNGDLRSRFNAAVADSLPGQVGEALADLPEPLAVAGRGAWDGSPPEHAELFVALPLAAVQQGEPDAVVAVVHLHDDDSDCEATDYRRVWNGVLRRFNLLQFLPGAWWTTRRGVERGIYPEFAPAAPGPTEPEPRGEWADALHLMADDLRAVAEQLAEHDVSVPEVGFELAGAGGRVLAEAELAWPTRRVVVLHPDRDDGAAAFLSAGWNVFGSRVHNLAELVAKALLEED